MPQTKLVTITENPSVSTAPDLLTIILAFLGFIKLTLAAYDINIPVEFWDHVANGLSGILAAYGIYKNTYALSKTAKQQKEVLEQSGLKKV